MVERYRINILYTSNNWYITLLEISHFSKEPENDKLQNSKSTKIDLN